MRRVWKKALCILCTLLLLGACAPAVLAADYQLSSTVLRLGENTVVTTAASTTLYVFRPTDVGAYVVSVEDPAATLTRWNGSKFYVAGLAEEAVDGKLTWECSSAGQMALIGLSGVDGAVITITEQEGYVPPEMTVYDPYENVHTPQADFAMPTEELTRVDIMQPQTVVADDNGIYHLGSVDGPILYVNMRAASYADLYACYYPTTGSAALYLHGTYLDETGQKRGYEFLDAMRPYANALDAEGYYYLTVDLATYILTYGQNQGWFSRDNSPFTLIKQGKFIAESAWLVNAYYVADTPIRGDVDGDGKVNNRDLGMLQQYLGGWELQVDLAVGDMNNDGKINNRDLGLLQQALTA